MITDLSKMQWQHRQQRNRKNEMNTRQLIAGAGMLALMTGPLTAARSQAEIVRPPGTAYFVSEGITVRG